MAEACPENLVTKPYFAYGSNIWLGQMERRCPDSRYTSVARLPDYRWIISARGYANIVHSPGDEVWGTIYNLPPTDEASLDRYEGVPVAYSKEMISVLLMTGESLPALVYIDYIRTEDGVVNYEYIGRMTHAIKDGVKKGIPGSYVEKYLLGPLKLGTEVLQPEGNE
ncbi:Gamma-glutamylcyclotransferase [Dactylellina cionopaga]|nr:Gamma-glutamylcyclotransferase [Dactylellina cionopaga]